MRVLKAVVLVVLVLLGVGLSRWFPRDEPAAETAVTPTQPQPQAPAPGPPPPPPGQPMPPPGGPPPPLAGGLPNYRPDTPRRTDLSGGATGEPLRLRYVVRDGAGNPIAGAKVEVWHTDARGGYSHAPEDFCRGWSETDADGVVEFQSVRPSSYGPPGGSAHIHSRISKDGVGERGDQIDLPSAVGESARGQQGLTARLEKDAFVVEATLPPVGPPPPVPPPPR